MEIACVEKALGFLINDELLGARGAEEASGRRASSVSVLKGVVDSARALPEPAQVSFA